MAVVLVSAAPADNDRHVCPADQEHDLSPACWCQPVLDYSDVVTGNRVWVHRRTHDTPHYIRTFYHDDDCPAAGDVSVGEPVVCVCGAMEHGVYGPTPQWKPR